jgi:hypothetical protein
LRARSFARSQALSLPRTGILTKQHPSLSPPPPTPSDRWLAASAATMPQFTLPLGTSSLSEEKETGQSHYSTHFELSACPGDPAAELTAVNCRQCSGASSSSSIFSASRYLISRVRAGVYPTLGNEHDRLFSNTITRASRTPPRAPRDNCP